MYTFILIVDSPAKPECAGDFLKNLGAVRQESDECYLVEGNDGMKDGWISITPTDTVVNDYDAEELAKIKQRISDPSYFLIEGRDTKTNFANNFILNFDNSLNALIDNDHGCIENINHIRELVLTEADWLHSSP